MTGGVSEWVWVLPPDGGYIFSIQLRGAVDGVKRAGGKHHSAGILAGRLSQADRFDSGDTPTGFESLLHGLEALSPWGKFTHFSEPVSSPENGDNNCTHL